MTTKVLIEVECQVPCCKPHAGPRRKRGAAGRDSGGEQHVSAVRDFLPPSFRDTRLRVGPESITTIGVYGFRACAKWRIPE